MGLVVAKNKSLFNLLGFKNNDLPETSFTIAIGAIEEIEEKIIEAEPYNILKVKQEHLIG